MSPLPSARAGGLDPGALRGSVAALFRPHRGTPRIGLEVEALCLATESGRPVPPLPTADGELSVVPALRRWAVAHRWREHRTPAGSPAFRGPGGATLSFEPGGQLEYATVPMAGLDDLIADLDGVLRPVAAALAREGIDLVARGVDPCNPLEGAALVVDGERYRRMASHYARRGPWGRRMMRQTAALHVNIDVPGPPFEGWRVAQAAAPVLTAAFANSSRVDGRPAGHRSVRAAQWRSLDPTRTGLIAEGGDPIRAYHDFALDADAFLLGPEEEPARPFRSWLDRADPGDWMRHLSTLFPEVRPRGYLEVRSIDALPLSLAPIPPAMLAGLLFDATARREASALLPPPDPALLERAGRLGLADPLLIDLALHLLEVAVAGLRRLGPSVAGPATVERVERFARTAVARGLDPASRSADGLVADLDGG